MLSSFASAQRSGLFSETLSASGVGAQSLTPITSGSTTYQLAYTTTGGPGGVSIQMEGSAKGDFTDTATCGSALTSTTGTSGTCSGVFTKVRANLTSLTGGATPTVTYALSASYGASGSGTLSSQVQGTAANGSAAVGNPVLVAGFDTGGSVIRDLLVNSAGALVNSVSVADADSVANNPTADTIGNLGPNGPLRVVPSLFNGVTWDRSRSASSSNAANSAQLGVNLADFPAQWNVINQPAAATAATISRTNVAGTKHVAKAATVCISAVAAQPDIIFNLRDGATGAGTIIWTWRLAVAAGTSRCESTNFSLIGTANTAMTLESASAPAATNFATVSISGYDLQ